MLVNGLPLPQILDLQGKKPWEVQHLDTMELWRFGDYKHYTSLNLLTTIFNIPSPKDDQNDKQDYDQLWHTDPKHAPLLRISPFILGPLEQLRRMI
jgi:hypothetical protein